MAVVAVAVAEQLPIGLSALMNHLVRSRDDISLLELGDVAAPSPAFCRHTVVLLEHALKQSHTGCHSRLCTTGIMWQGSVPRFTHMVLSDHFNICQLYI